MLFSSHSIGDSRRGEKNSTHTFWQSLYLAINTLMGIHSNPKKVHWKAETDWAIGQWPHWTSQILLGMSTPCRKITRLGSHSIRHTLYWAVTPLGYVMSIGHVDPDRSNTLYWAVNAIAMLCHWIVEDALALNAIDISPTKDESTLLKHVDSIRWQIHLRAVSQPHFSCFNMSEHVEWWDIIVMYHTHRHYWLMNFLSKLH